LSRGQNVCTSVAELPPDPSDADLLALRLGGRDAFSGMKLLALRARFEIPELEGHPYECAALRWRARGLSDPLCVRWAAAMQGRFPVDRSRDRAQVRGLAP